MLDKYYQGILGRIRAEVDAINSLFAHQGLKGEGNENVLRELLRQFIGKRYAVGSGVVIDHTGGVSRQCDTVLYDNHLYPSLFSMTSMHLYPIDVVYATIEVKTTLTSTEAAKAIDNLASVRRLKPQDPSPRPRMGWPFGLIFAYNSDAQAIKTFNDWFVANPEFQNLYALVVCLDQGIINKLGDKPKTLTFPVGSKDQYVIPDRHQDPYSYEGRLYPVTKADEHFVLVDQARLLVYFLLMLNDMLRYRQLDPHVDFRAFFGDAWTLDVH
jgi:hypothetical protein